MSNYTIAIPWSGKDALSDSDPLKVISGGEFNTEFTTIADAIKTKSDLNGSNSESFSASTAQSGTNTAQVATTSFVTTAIDNLETTMALGTHSQSDITVSSEAPTGGEDGDVHYQV